MRASLLLRTSLLQSSTDVWILASVRQSYLAFYILGVGGSRT